MEEDNTTKDSQIPQEGDSEDLVAKCDEYKLGWQRAMADYANLKREAERQRLDLSKYANAGFIAEMLPAIENLRKAAQHEPKPQEGTEYPPEVTQWISGLKAIRQQLDSALAKSGVEYIDQSGIEFDPNVHEAVMTRKVDGIESGQVIEVLEAGCKLHDRVIKPARVAVSE